VRYKKYVPLGVHGNRSLLNSTVNIANKDAPQFNLVFQLGACGIGCMSGSSSNLQRDISQCDIE
jgi:hypothetical protein